jgi:hypothetical protein
MLKILPDSLSSSEDAGIIDICVLNSYLLVYAQKISLRSALIILPEFCFSDFGGLKVPYAQGIVAFQWIVVVARGWPTGDIRWSVGLPWRISSLSVH